MIRSIACMPQLYTLHTAAINHITLLHAVIEWSVTWYPCTSSNITGLEIPHFQCCIHTIVYKCNWDKRPWSIQYTYHMQCVYLWLQRYKNIAIRCTCQRYHHQECMCQKHRYKVGMCAHTKMAGRDSEEHAQKVHVRCECASTELTR